MISPHGRDLLVWIAVFTTINLVAVGLRFYIVARVKKRPLRTDDFLILLSVSSMLAMEGTTIWAICHGLGAPTASLTWPDIAVTIKLLVSAFWTWTISTCACKLAILYLYNELFHTHRIFKRAMWVLVVLCVAYVPTFIAFFMTQCSPVSAAWDQVKSVTHCRTRTTHELASVAINAVLDLFVVLLPIPVIWKLQMPVKKKVAVTGVFSLGFLVIGIMIWRLVSTAKPDPNPDLVYDAYLLALQSHLELWLGILAANLPSLAPLFNRFKTIPWSKYLPKIGSGNSRSDSNSSSLRIKLKTFGGSSGRPVPKQPNHSEFGILDDQNSEERVRMGTIVRSHDFVVTVGEDNSGHHV